MMQEPSFAGYTLAELESLCLDRAIKRDDSEVMDRYQRAAIAALPFLLARLRQNEKRRRG